MGGLSVGLLLLLLTGCVSNDDIRVAPSPTPGAPGDDDSSSVTPSPTAPPDVDADGDGGSPGDGDCDDNDSSIHPGAAELPADGIDQDCDGEERCYLDADGDGYRPEDEITTTSSDFSCSEAGLADASAPDGDCDDGDDGIHPDAEEVAGDEIDENCDGDELCYRDADGDGYRSEDEGTRASSDLRCDGSGEAAASAPAGDCDDDDATVRPDAPEIAGDEIDEDCDGDELCFIDEDGDGYRSEDEATATSSDVSCGGSGEAPASAPTGDCDDGNAGINPDAEELVGDEIDQDCDGGEICYQDQDQDGYRTGLTSDSEDAGCGAAGEASASAPDGDCDDEDGALYPLAPELCDGIDNDCDAVRDEGLPPEARFFLDNDRDAYGDEDQTVIVCVTTAPDGTSALRGDCNDADATRYPGAADADKDSVDRDCGGTDAPEPNVGLPSSAYATLQAAIDAAPSGGTVWVGPGTYYERNLVLPADTLTLKSVALEEVTTIDAQASAMDPARPFTIILAGEPTIDGFTLTGGYSSDVEASPSYLGGAIRFSYAHGTITHCRFINNVCSLDHGGAVYLGYNDSPPSVIRYCTFEGNRSLNGAGGAIHLKNAAATISHCVFTGNSATQGGGAINVAVAIDDGYSGGASIEDSVFTDNLASSDTDVTSGGAIRFLSTNLPVSVERCRFSGNSADYGGAMYLEPASTSPDDGLLTVSHCLLNGNSASLGGGAIYIFKPGLITGSTIVGNTASFGGGIYLAQGDGQPTIRLEDSIVAYNTDFNLQVEPEATAELYYNDFYAPDDGNNISISGIDASNLILEPQLLAWSDDGDPDNDDLHLALGSPLIDAGDEAEQDIDGSRLDIGCYGGSDGGALDLDGDGFPEYFWPGSLEDAPAGYDPLDFDCDDSDGETAGLISYGCPEPVIP